MDLVNNAKCFKEEIHGSLKPKWKGNITLRS